MSAQANTPERGTWNSKLGFILAASGSAIGLGNIVFFASNAYQFGGGAFYLPYFFALFALGIPVMILEFGLGTMTRRSFPEALYRVSGRKGELVGWWSIGAAGFITMYYIAILGWALGMMVGAFGSLFEGGISAPFAPLQTPTAPDEPSAMVYFFNLITTWWPMLCVAIIWALNIAMLIRGTKTIEAAVRIFVPLMWVFMIVLIVRGLTLPGGMDGVLYLFNPDFDGIRDPNVWKGAFSQMFFSLSLGLGTMTAYASYLPKDADQVNNSLLVSFMNCGFEYLAGIAIFALLFVFALNPVGGTLSLSFFVIPQGIAEFPWGIRLFGFFFFFLVVIAGLTSSISLIEGPASALIDKLGISRGKALTLILIPGVVGSMMYTLPTIIDPNLAGNGTLGLSLLDVMDHWAFNYSLLTVGFFECILVGWVLGADTLRQEVNRYSKFHLGRWFNVVIKFIAPGLLITVLLWSLFGEFFQFVVQPGFERSGVWISDTFRLLTQYLSIERAPLYGSAVDVGSYNWIPVVIPFVWLIGTLGFAAYLTFGRSYPPVEADPLPFREPKTESEA